MQDRYKFKVWCKTNKEWEKDEICITNKERYVVATNPELTKIIDIEPRYHEIVFSTGLKDKNGKLIFEGDILKYTSKPTSTQKNNFKYKPYTENYSVVWEDFYTGYNLQNREKVNCFNLGIMTKDCEVIGNIYENPELLKEGE